MIWKIIVSVMFLSVFVACVVAAMPAAVAANAGIATGYALGGGAALSLYSVVTVWQVKS